MWSIWTDRIGSDSVTITYRLVYFCSHQMSFKQWMHAMTFIVTIFQSGSELDYIIDIICTLCIHCCISSLDISLLHYTPESTTIAINTITPTVHAGIPPPFIIVMVIVILIAVFVYSWGNDILVHEKLQTKTQSPIISEYHKRNSRWCVGLWLWQPIREER